jgi:hypothetical protein
MGTNAPPASMMRLIIKSYLEMESIPRAVDSAAVILVDIEFPFMRAEFPLIKPNTLEGPSTWIMFRKNLDRGWDQDAPKAGSWWENRSSRLGYGRMRGGNGRMRFFKIFSNPFVPNVDRGYGRNGRIQPQTFSYIHM